MKETDLFIVQRPSGVDSGTYKVAASDIPANAVVSATAPTDPMDGGLWFDSNSDTLKTWNGTAWVESSSGGGVTSITAGTGISVDKATGDVTITNTGGGGGDVINYSGASAWGDIASGGAINASLNIANVTTDGSGYVVTFSTPMPSANYAISSTPKSGPNSSFNYAVEVVSQTNTGFQVYLRRSDGAAGPNPGFSFSVHATNALPPKGGTGTDSWGSVQADGTLESSFNVASVTRTAQGKYEVVFTSPMPSSTYGVVLSGITTSQFSGKVTSRTTEGFSLETLNAAQSSNGDRGFSFTVNATNATLPLSFSSEQIESAINNPGCSAWAQVAENGNVAGSLNISDVNRTGAGKYQYTFATPMPNANYSVIGSVSGLFSTNGVLSIGGITANGFLVTIKQISDSTNTDKDHAVTVFATNALPPKGGTGTDAWGNISSNATIQSSFNIDNVVRSEQGRYLVTFTNPMPDTNYLAEVNVQAAANGFSFPANKTVNGFLAVINGTGGGAADLDFGIIVHATNATLPDSFSEEQIQSVVDLAKSGATNPGASAWGYISGASGGLTGGLNISSVTRTGTGQYDVVFATPMPSAVYSVVTGVSPNSNRNVQVWNQTATGFTTRVDTPSDSSDINFVVFATNALPPKGGTGTDAWANVSADGTILSSFNATVVKAAGNGDYDITFVNPMPTADYAVTATVSGDPAIAYGYSCITNNKTSAGFRVSIVGDNSGTFTDNDFSFTVNATNATLPSTFTVAQFNDLVARVTALENP